MANFDVITLIAEYVDPDPILFCRLATVNKDFYKVFTSDKVWAPLNVYRLKTGIYHDFVQKSRRCMGLMESVWRWKNDTYMKFKGKPAHFIPLDVLSNQYMILGSYLKHTFYTWYESIKDLQRSSLMYAIDINPTVVTREEREYKSNQPLQEFLLKACSREMLCYKLLPRSERSSAELCRKIVGVFDPKVSKIHPLNVFCWGDDAEGTYASPAHVEELVEYSLKKDPAVIFDALARVPDSSYVAKLLEELQYDRPALLDAVRGRASALKLLLNFVRDKQVYLEALSLPQIRGPPTELPGFDQWNDVDIVTAAVKIDPKWLLVAPNHFMSNKEVVLTMLQTHPHILVPYLNAIDKKLLLDPEILGLVIDKHLHYYVHSDKLAHSQDFVGTEWSKFEYPRDLVHAMFDNYKWSKARLFANSCAWHLVSDRLKEIKSLFTFAIKCARVDGYLKLNPFPNQYQNDKEIIELAATAGFLNEFSDKLLSRETIVQTVEKFGLHRYPQYANDAKLAWNLMLKNPETIKFIDPEALSSAYFKQKVSEHAYELGLMWDHLSYQEIMIEHFGPGPNWQEIDHNKSLELLAKNPALYIKMPAGESFEFALEAVSVNPDVVFYMGDENGRSIGGRLSVEIFRHYDTL